MKIGLIGKKLGMTRIYKQDGSTVPVTVIHVAGNQVVHGLLDGQGPHAVERALTAVRDALAGHAGPHGVVLSGKAWLVTARA